MRAATIVLLALAAGCQPRTEIVIGVATDIRAPDILDSATLTVSNIRDGVPQLMQSWDITGIPNVPVNLPGSYGILSPDGASHTISVLLEGTKGGSTVVTRTAIVSLVPGKTLFLRMGMVAGCMNRTDCGPTQTCVEGRCVDPTQDEAMLPIFKDELITTLTCNSGTAFINTADGTPMPMAPDASSCPSQLCKEGTCLVPPMAGSDNPDGGANFADAGVTEKPDAGLPMRDGGTSMADAGIGPTGTCPGEVALMGMPVTSSPLISSLATDGTNVVFTDSMVGRVLMTGPCGGAPQPIATGQTSPSGAVVVGGQVFWVSGTSINGAPVVVGAAPFTVTTGATGNNGTLASDGKFLYYTTANSVMRVQAIPNAGAPSAIGASTTASTTLKQITAGPDFVAWYASNNAAINWLQISLPTNAKSFPVTSSRGILAFGGGGALAFTDYPTGLNVSMGGNTPMTVVPTTVWGNFPSRIATDNRYLYVMSFAGSPPNRIVRVTSMLQTTTVVDGISSIASSTTNPAFIATPQGLYWLDSTNSMIYRAPTPP